MARKPTPPSPQPNPINESAKRYLEEAQTYATVLAALDRSGLRSGLDKHVDAVARKGVRLGFVHAITRFAEEVEAATPASSQPEPSGSPLPSGAEPSPA